MDASTMRSYERRRSATLGGGRIPAPCLDTICTGSVPAPETSAARSLAERPNPVDPFNAGFAIPPALLSPDFLPRLLPRHFFPIDPLCSSGRDFGGVRRKSRPREHDRRD